METDLNFWLQLFTVAFCIGLGGRYGGVGLGAAGGLGVCILVLFFGLKPSSRPFQPFSLLWPSSPAHRFCRGPAVWTGW